MMFYRAGTYSVVESDETGIMQHDALSWHLLGKNFALVDDFNSASDLYPYVRHIYCKIVYHISRKIANILKGSMEAGRKGFT